MSMSPARLSRRSLLRGAASLTVVAALATVTACADDAAGDLADGGDPGDAASPLLRLGRSLAGAPAGAPVGPGEGAGALTTDDAVVRDLAGRSDDVTDDFTAGRVRSATGWQLADTEAAVLERYAGACPTSSC